MRVPCAAAIVALLLVVSSGAGRASELPYAFDRTYGELPKTVGPVSYALSLTPDIAAMTFRGTESVVVNVLHPTPSIVLNADGLTIDAATFDAVAVPRASDADRQQIALSLPQAAAVGRHVMTLTYHGPIGSDAQGLFALHYRAADGSPATLLSTFFESTNARRMFPCWDEPAFRASFAIAIAIPKAWTAIGNMPVASRVEDGDVATVTFAPTPPMATYLVHITAGVYRALHSTGGGIPQAIWAPAGTEGDGAYALAGMERILPAYAAYFAQPYPLPKLDHIAIPGGFNGAMENWGAIAYEADNVLVPADATIGARENAYRDFSHEMAHQWFGDLVTMAWWDDLWLNESFADWLSIKTTDAFNPSWRFRESIHRGKETALDVDAQLSSRPIRRPVARGQDVLSQFDGLIQYVKGRSVIGMLEAYAGTNAFRDGLRAYMAAHRFSNTTGADLWSALDRASGKPIDAVAGTWIEQPGFPLVSVATQCDARGARTARFSQARFSLIGSEPKPERWLVPIAYASGAGATRRLLLRGVATTVAAGRCGETLRANADDLGFYRVAYDAPTRAANLHGFAAIPAIDKLTMIGDAWALARAGRASPLDVFALANAMGRDVRPSVWLQIADIVQAIDGYERGKPGRAAFRAAALRLIAPVVAKLGWDASPSETEPSLEELRERLIALAGTFGDAATVAEAQRRFAAERAGTHSLTADQQQTVYAIVGRNADAATFAQLLTLAGGSDRAVARRAIAAMVLAGDPVLRKRALEYVVSPALPAEDAGRRAFWVGASADVDPAMAWSVFAANEDLLFAPLDALSRSFAAQGAIGTYGDAVPLETIQANVAARVPGAAAPIAAAVQRARDRQTIAARVLPAIDAYAERTAAGNGVHPWHGIE
jgi:aminopeptidase N